MKNAGVLKQTNLKLESKQAKLETGLDMTREEVWEYYYNLAVAFYGSDTVEVSRNSKDDSMFTGVKQWLKIQKIRLKDGSLNSEQIAKLKRLNVKWNNLSTAVKSKLALEAAIEYHNSNTNLLVPSGFTVNIASETNIDLSKWLHNQRTYFTKGILKPEVTAKLNELGMIWNCREHTWFKHYEDILKYYQVNKNVNFSKDLTLGEGEYCFHPSSFISLQRQKYQAGNLSTEKIELLKKVGIDFEHEIPEFDRKYNCVQAYYQKNGNLVIPGSLEMEYMPGKKFKPHNWLQSLRNLNNAGAVSDEKVELLTRIGMVWYPRTDKDEKTKLIYFYHLEKCRNASSLMRFSCLEVNARICFCNYKRQPLIGKDNTLNEILTESSVDLERDYNVSLGDLLFKYEEALKLIRK